MILLTLFSTTALLAIAALGYPVFLAVAATLLGGKKARLPDTEPISSTISAELPLVTIIIPVHEAALGGIAAKLENLNRLDYPVDKLTIIVAGDGVPGESLQECKNVLPDRDVKCIGSSERLGKNQNLNKAIAAVDGEIVFFSDADAALDPAAIMLLVQALTPANVGGVTGRIVLSNNKIKEGDAQSAYWGMEAFIRQKEMVLLGSVTSNSGTLCAIRRSLFKEIPPSATDDLFLALTVVSSGFDFVSEPRAKAYITPPSRDLRHEIIRRRRIVTRSLGSIWHSRSVFRVSPAYGLCLFVHKILRRLVPLLLVVMFLSSIGLSQQGVIWKVVFDIEVIVLILCGLILLVPGLQKPTRYLRYFTAGALGTTLGVVDFLLGRRRATWE